MSTLPTCTLSTLRSEQDSEMWDTMWVIGTEPGSLAKATSAYNCWGTSLVLKGFFLLFCFGIFWDKESLYRLGYFQTHDSPASVFWELGLQVCTTMLGFKKS